MHALIKSELQKSAATLNKIMQDELLLQKINKVANYLVNALQDGKKILFAGNGGSAADAQHLAAELVCRLRYDRPGLAAFALTTDTSILTAISNDYAFSELFSRQVAALGNAGDIFIGISTSGKSPNILQAFKAAKEKNLLTIGFTGVEGLQMSELCDMVLNVPTDETAKIQECHILFGHIICAIVEDVLFGAQYDPAQMQAHTHNKVQQL